MLILDYSLQHGFTDLTYMNIFIRKFAILLCTSLLCKYVRRSQQLYTFNK
jgi:hypothetical protein